MQLKSLIVLGAALVVASGARASFLQCEDSSLCPDGATCCKIDDEAWGCCPYEFGQCCEDGRHCCPTGYSCDGDNSSCTHKVTQQRLFGTVLEQVPPLARDQRDEVPRESSVGNVRCPDGNYCLDGQTCCLLASGHYGCCPYQHAECCSDHSSCCPEGYQCRVSTHQCVHATTNHTVAMVKKVDPIVPALTSVASLRNELSVQNIRCPDGNYCNDGQTCCLLTSGQYGCCPYAHAQCCSDHASCCPEGYICKVSTHQCLHAATNHTMPMVQKVQPVLLSSATPEVTELSVQNIRCPDGNYCKDGQTCCLLTSGQYGCCPYAHAQCCSDHASCCPEGYTCKVSTHQCLHAATNHTMPMVQKVQPVLLSSATPEVTELSVQNIRCPDGNYCKDGQTCCLLTSGQYGCCPYAHAQCCSDHASCCPEGYTCKVSTHQCLHAATNHTMPMVQKVQPVLLSSATPEVTELSVQNIRCPDGNYCKDGQTCCLLTSGQYGCCPYAHAQCCSDHASCCPEGYTCKVSTHQCLHAATNHTMPMVQKVQPVLLSSATPEVTELSVQNIRCPDGNYCKDGQTCCLLTSGQYGCCPYAHAQCCSDHASCCPEGYTCKVSTHQCLHAATNHTMPMVQKVQPVLLSSATPEVTELSVQNIRCPDGNYCKDGQTCCLLTSGQYGCCPYAHAQCCSDHASCCPEGYTCKVSTHQCLHAATNHTMPMVQKVQPVLLSSATPEVTGELIRCPDGAFCQDTQTCCLQKSGRYGCCPYVHAQCCSDHTSCCPEGFRCKVSTRQCIHAASNHTVAMLQKVDSIVPEPVELPPQKSDGIMCPDGHKCLNGQTCCQLTSGKYGCCPLPEAVCCTDHLTCCPRGYQCRVATQTCQLADHTVPAVRKLPSFTNAALIEVAESSVGKVRCPDGNYCLNGQTCCLLTSGHYGCCPYQHAECCSDHSSCCPEGYQCRVSTHQCVHATTNHTVAMVKKVDPIVPALRSVASLRNVPNQMCPDGNECEDDQTCCMLQSGSYGCCPYNQAVCCDDREHCCPAGYTCDTQTARCLKGDLSSPLMRPLVPKRRSSLMNTILVDVPNQMCPDGNECEDNQTCCMLQSGSYGCCPYNQAVCCDDREHCCPAGYTCDTQTARCLKGDLSSPLMRPLVPKRRSSLMNTILVDGAGEPEPSRWASSSSSIVCPGGRTTCSSSAKCCLWYDKLSWFCCPYANGTCCGDGTFCCKAGFYCFVPTQSCIPYGERAPAVVGHAANYRQEARARVQVKTTCPDQSTCPDKMTCCQSTNSTYVCCPFDKATCCKDGEHCCPEGYQCDEARRMCTRKLRPEDVPALNEFPSDANL
ncbi:uncharacterized protein [Dermacentor andersoni]|uniref:uncharacterized protein isoform X3 n=1 Tax=Dermacentor andersoni TaxID=34620 RepID=UPI002416F03E|nr:zonadhesin-like isoform X3 [Dermacentor andersoni]